MNSLFEIGMWSLFALAFMLLVAGLVVAARVQEKTNSQKEAQKAAQRVWTAPIWILTGIWKDRQEKRQQAAILVQQAKQYEVSKIGFEAYFGFPPAETEQMRQNTRNLVLKKLCEAAAELASAYSEEKKLREDNADYDTMVQIGEKVARIRHNFDEGVRNANTFKYVVRAGYNSYLPKPSKFSRKTA